MSANNIMLLVLTIEVTLLILPGIALTILTLKLVQSIRRVVDKAEDVIDTAESVADTFKGTKGSMSVLKLIFNIIKMVKGKEHGKKK